MKIQSRAIFAFIIGLILGWVFWHSLNPIPLYLMIIDLMLILTALTSVIYGRLQLPKRDISNNINIINPVLEQSEPLETRLYLPQKPSLFYTYFASLRHQLAKHILHGNLKESFSINSRSSYLTNLNGLVAGNYPISQVKVTIYDLLGMFAISKKISYQTQIVVLPQSIPTDWINPQQTMSAASSSSSRSFLRSSESFFDYKIYEPGDDARRILWKRFAKGGNLQVRLPEERENFKDTIFLLFDDVLHIDSRIVKIPYFGHRILAIYWQIFLWRLTERIIQLWKEKMNIHWNFISSWKENGKYHILENGNPSRLYQTLWQIFNHRFIPANKNFYLAEKMNRLIWLISSRSHPSVQEYILLNHKILKQSIFNSGNFIDHSKQHNPHTRQFFFRNQSAPNAMIRTKPYILHLFLYCYCLLASWLDFIKTRPFFSKNSNKNRLQTNNY